MYGVEDHQPDHSDEVARVIRERMKRLGMSRKMLSRLSGVSLQTINEILGNKAQRRRRPESYAGLAKALRLPMGYLARIAAGENLPEPQDPTDSDAYDLVHDKLDTLTVEIHDVKETLALLIPNRHVKAPKRPRQAES